MNHPTRTRLARAVRVVWVLGFLVGTMSHVVDLVLDGVQAYVGFPVAVRVFWVALTVLDPAVIVLLLLRRRAGVVLGVAVMLVDVAVNGTMFATTGELSLFGVVNQCLFLALVTVTAPILWHWFSDVPDSLGPRT